MIQQLSQAPVSPVIKLTGSSLPAERFVIKEYDGYVDGEAIVQVLNGEIAGCHFRGVIPSSACEAITANFWRNPGRSERRDGVPGHLIGSSHFGKGTMEYLHDVARTRAFVDALFEKTENPLHLLGNAIQAALSKNGKIYQRPHDGDWTAGDCRAISWTARGQYMLAPHDDFAQLGTEAQRDFEIQKTRNYTVVPVNLYPHIPAVGGKLQVWNIQPDDACRDLLERSEQGYPYTHESLEGVDSVVIDIHTGDVVLINGAQVHGVTGYAQQGDLHEQDMRLLLTYFMGFINSKTAVWWT